MPDVGDKKSTARLEAFSDGVFAIAMTLLVLDIQPIPVQNLAGPHPVQALMHELAADWPSLLAFVTSFFSILTMWMHHHLVLRMVRSVDGVLMVSNGLLLCVVTFVPFPTKVLAEGLSGGAPAASTLFYAGSFFLVALAFQALIWGAFRPGVLDPHAPKHRIQKLRKSYLAGPPLYLLAALIAPAAYGISLAICSALWMLWIASLKTPRQADEI